MELAEKGFGGPHDVLAYIAYAAAPITRAERATAARAAIATRFGSKQQGFLEFVLSHYVSQGVRELGLDKLSPLLKLKYHDSLSDAQLELGSPADIASAFAGFQQFLYQKGAVDARV